MLLLLFFRRLFQLGLYIVNQNVNALFGRERRCVKTDIIVIYIAPCVVCVKIIIIRAAFVRLVYRGIRVLFAHSLAFHKILRAHVLVGIKKNLYQIRVVAQYIIRAPSDNNARALRRDFFDYVGLELENIIAV